MRARSRPSVLAHFIMSRTRKVALALFIITALSIYVLYPFSRSEVEKLLHVHGTSPALIEKAIPPSGVAKCTKPLDPSKPLLQYAVMIDAGSTGSRVHVYRFNNCGNTPELEDEIFEQTKPGLSSFKANAKGAAESLDSLLQVALKGVPETDHSCTPIAVKATAGLRILGQELSENILSAVRTRLQNMFPFPVVPGDGVSIMDGKDEGVYAWITTNYLLGKIGGPDETPSAAVFDLGGGSTQVVFEPTFPMAAGGMPETLQPGDHRYELDFGGRKFDLYQHSHLGFGLMEARKAIHQAIVKGSQSDVATGEGRAIVNPCIAPGMSRVVEVDGEEKGNLKVNMTGPTEAAAAQCRFIAESVLQKDAECQLAPCSFNGVHQPSLAKTFSREDVYIFSYFYDRTAPLGMPASFSLKELGDLTARVCGGEQQWSSFSSIEGAMDELRDRPEYCLDLNFMLALLHTGYELPMDRQVNIAKKIKGNELGWCLGASLPLLDQNQGGWECKIKEVS